MSVSKLATIKVPASTKNYTKGREHKINKIVLHHFASILTAKQCGQIFQSSKRGASAHYGIGKDLKIGSYVDESDTAWANGNRTVNHESISIELSNCSTGGKWEVSDKVIALAIKLVADIAKRHGLGKLVAGENLCWHNMFASTICPGLYLESKINYIALEANKLNGYSNMSTSKKKTTTEIAKEVIAGKWGNGTEREKKLVDAGYNYSTIQKKVNELMAKKSTSSSAPKKKSTDTIVKEVIAGKWGNGTAREKKLKSAGYDYDAIQKKVNAYYKKKK